jgi:hypothetical protein
MKKNKLIPVMFALIVSCGHLFAQDRESILKEAEVKKVFEKNFQWGVSWNQYWGTIKGANLPADYFDKPCVGFNLHAAYYPLDFIGARIGFGLQQRGAGILNEDKSGGSFTHPWEFPQYNGDSTYRQRLRFNTVEVPLSIELRTPMDVIKGIRLSGSVGAAWYTSKDIYDIFLVVEDGYHRITDVSADYRKRDIALQMSGGADINAGESCIFQVHFVYTKSTRNVYQTGNGDGRLATYGIRVAWLF